MRNGLYALLSTLVLTLPAAAQEGPIRSTIESQIQAFQADDFARQSGVALGAAAAVEIGTVVVHDEAGVAAP